MTPIQIEIMLHYYTTPLPRLERTCPDLLYCRRIEKNVAFLPRIRIIATTPAARSVRIEKGNDHLSINPVPGRTGTASRRMAITALKREANQKLEWSHHSTSGKPEVASRVGVAHCCGIY